MHDGGIGYAGGSAERLCNLGKQVGHAVVFAHIDGVKRLVHFGYFDVTDRWRRGGSATPTADRKVAWECPEDRPSRPLPKPVGLYVDVDNRISRVEPVDNCQSRFVRTLRTQGDGSMVRCDVIARGRKGGHIERPCRAARPPWMCG